MTIGIGILILLALLASSYFGYKVGKDRRHKWHQKNISILQNIANISENGGVGVEQIIYSFENSGYLLITKGNSKLVFGVRKKRIESYFNNLCGFVGGGPIYLCYLCMVHFSSKGVGGLDYTVEYSLE